MLSSLAAALGLIAVCAPQNATAAVPSGLAGAIHAALGSGPITPTWSTTSSPAATLTNSSGSSTDELGFSVAISSDGTTAVVGAPAVNSSEGAAYVFHASSAGAWKSSAIPVATLTDGNSGKVDDFGESVAISADGATVVVGAPGVNQNQGSADVFHVASEGAWTSRSAPTAILTNGATPSWAVTALGYSVAISADGTTVLVGAPQDQAPAPMHSQSGDGVAYVFHAGSEASWTTTGAPTATLSNGTAPGTEFVGWSVALTPDGTTAIVGAPGHGSNSDFIKTYGVGAAYVFHVAAEGSWATSSSPAALTHPGSGGDDEGLSVAISSDGTTAVAGAPGGYSQSGVIFVYHASSASSWASSSSPAYVRDTNPLIQNLGLSVAISPDGTTAFAGAPETNGRRGAVDVFTVASESSWVWLTTPTATLTNAAGAAGDQLGSALAVSGNGATVLTGATTPDHGLFWSPGYQDTQGAAYVFRGSLPQESLSVSKAGAGRGTVTSTPSGIECGPTCSAQFDAGQRVSLRAMAAKGSRFAGWSGGGCGGTGVCTVTMNAAVHVTATFRLIPKPSLPQFTRIRVNRTRHRASFAFRAAQATGYQCALQRSGRPRFVRCSSPKVYTGLKTGSYTFQVRGVSAAGPGPAAKHQFTI